MGDAEELFMDGTHTMKPPQFAQLYVVRAPLGETSVPVAYAFLPSKDQPIYEEMLGALLDACTAQGKTASPKRVIIDFEKAMINAVQCVLDTAVHCCFYHLTQSTYRHVADNIKCILQLLIKLYTKHILFLYIIILFYILELHNTPVFKFT